MSKFLVTVNYIITSQTGLSIDDVQNLINNDQLHEYSSGSGKAVAIEVLPPQVPLPKLPNPQELAKDICSVQPMKNWKLS